MAGRDRTIASCCDRDGIEARPPKGSGDGAVAAASPPDEHATAPAEALRRVSVLLPHKLAILTYLAADDVVPGTIVAVPLGARRLLGVVWDDPPDDAIEDKRLKIVTPVPGAQAVSADLRRFTDFFAHYTMTPRGAAVRLILRSPEAFVARKPPTRIEPGEGTGKVTAKRQKVLDALKVGPMERPQLAKNAGVSPAVITAMLSTGLLRIAEDAGPPHWPGSPRLGNLTDGQRTAAAPITKAVEDHRFAPILLEGVTGSGKTEVYLDAVAAALSAGRQALILMPEIALTPMVVERITERFGAPPGEWHSSRTSAARADLWREVAHGRLPIVVGARSALFLPFPDLGVIVVDEEHDQSYKQEETIIYHARDMAIVRAQMAQIPVVLASATPSVETRLNADLGRYQRVTLPARFGAAKLPTIATVDLRQDTPERGTWLAPSARAAIDDTLKRGRQALLFLNRRGYAPLTVCRSCGHRILCPNCSAALTEHRFRPRLTCHHCGYDEPRPTHGPECHAEDSLVACGPGVERVAEEAASLWPDARLMVLSSDLGGPQAMAEALKAIADGRVDIIVGTQIVAKGHNFSGLELVVVVDADLGLENADPRAAERTFQLLTQVTGRAGRASEDGRALLQTHAPDHPVMDAMIRSDREAFYAQETEIRRTGGLPPFKRLAAIIVSATDRSEAYGYAAALARTAPHRPIEVLGPAEAPLALLRGRYRFRLLVRAPRAVPLQDALADWLAGVPVTGTVRRMVDIDPYSFL
ncbi:MAG: primosomal protein N' [Pseudomonadota bacterium]